MTATPPRDWTALRWPDLAAADTANWIAVLPLAATEQHGPHLPHRHRYPDRRSLSGAGKAALAPSVPASFLPLQSIGLSSEHGDFPGTLTLPPDVVINSWLAIGESVAAAGLRKMVLVTSHGGNSAAMTLAAQELRARHGMLAVTTSWARFGVPDGLFSADELRHGIHGGAIETSIMLAHAPQLVDLERIDNFQSAGQTMAQDYRWLSTQRPAPMAWQTQDLHESGAVGDAREASADKGRLLIDHGAQAFCALLEDVARFDLAALDRAPQV
ncbi:MAG: creatininase family protein [Rhodopseudomonas palustris]|nr:creatininase family protein [Rhodopseudomonas palustris]